MRTLDAQRIETKIRSLAASIYGATARMRSGDPRYPCSICGTDAEAGVNVLTMAGETFSKVAATFGVGRSAVYRHRKHFAERILVDREGAKRVMNEVQAFADEKGLPVTDLWCHFAHADYPVPTDQNWPWGLEVLALAGIEPYCCQLAESLLRIRNLDVER